VANQALMPVVTLGAYAHLGLGLVRSFGRLGIPVYVLDENLDTPAFYSKYCTGRFHRGMDFAANSMVELLGVSKKIGQKSILIPTDDRACIFVAKNADNLSERFIFPDITVDLVRSLVSKKELYTTAKSHGVPTAETIAPNCREELEEFVRRYNFPIVAKAIHGWRWNARGGKTIIVQTRRELLTLYEFAHPNLILQEYIPGGDETNWIFNGYFDAKSDCLFGYTGKKIRQWPPKGGITTLGVCSKNESIDQTAKKFLAALGYKGIIDMDFRYDTRDGKYKLLDVNPRVGSTFRLFVSETGTDVARTLYKDLTEQQISTQVVRDGRKWVVENFDLLAILNGMNRRELTLTDLRDSFVGVQETAYFASDDLLPCICFCNRLFASAAFSSLFYGD
jgi:predicted ATP-grasp superfamily ATP-dependent carboligase